jgi:uncharacterized protein YlzI (FlbEa/FlbD family)
MSEHAIQAAIIEFLRQVGILAIETDCMSGLQFFSHKDNRRYAFINHHKKMGYIKGQPDLILFLRDGKTLCVEVKRPKHYQSKEQKEFERKLKDHNHNYLVWKGVEDAEEWRNKQTASQSGEV